jgi:hypothetical protein
MVAQALMWARLVHQQREAALEPYLICLDIQRLDHSRAVVPGSRRMHWDSTTGLTPELMPLWFDRTAAASALPRVKEVLTTFTKPVPPGAFVYATALAHTAGDRNAAALYHSLIGDSPRAIADLGQILKAQQQVALGEPALALSALETLLGTALDTNKPLIQYTIGLARSKVSDAANKKDAALDFLAVAALHGDEPELAAASLDHARRILAGLNDAAAADKLGAELRDHFPNTYFGSRLGAGATEK